MEELKIPFDKLIHPNMEALHKRDEFMSAMLDRPYDHLWDMYYDEFEDENLENEPSLDEWTAHEYPREQGS